MHRRKFLFAAQLSLAIACPLACATDLHFDYTSFDNPNMPGVSPHFGQSQFNVLNYPSINGNYMMTSTDAHRAEMTANNNTLAEFYNWLEQRYEAHTTKDGNLSADEINSYVVSNSNNNGPRPNWIILNEISSSLWPPNAGDPSLSTYRQWLVNCVTRLHDYYGYSVVTYAPFATVGTGTPNNGASWRALAAKSYIGVENYLSGAEVMAGGTDYASRVAWAQNQYNKSVSTYGAVGVPLSGLFLGEEFANTTTGTGWGRGGVSASDWDTVIQIRADAIHNIGFPGFLAYAWGSNTMNITEAEQIQHEYWARTRLVTPDQQPQWLSDGAPNVNGTIVPLSWSEQLNWIGGVPNGVGAIANFYKTNTAARTITLDGSKTVGKLSFNSPNSYTINPGTDGSITLSNPAAGGTLAVTQGSHTIAVPLVVAGTATFDIAGTLSLTAGLSSTSAGTINRSGAGTLNISGAQSHAAGELFVASGGTTNFNSSGGSNLSVTITAATVNFNTTQSLAAVTINAGGKGALAASATVANVSNISIPSGQFDVGANAMVARSGSVGTFSSGGYSGITGMVQAGRHGGLWNGAGIITSQSAAKGASPLTTLGVASASDALGISPTQTRTWHGQTVNGDAVLLAYTYAGDANLSGRIDADDYFQIDSHYGKTADASKSYFNGDFNYDGLLNGDDYVIIDSNYIAQGTPFSGAAPVNGSIAVPEPAGAALLMLGAALGWFRRRRR